MQNIGHAFAAAVLAATVIGGPAQACSKPDLGPEIFCGSYRAGVKTSFNRDPQGAFAPVRSFGGITGLLASLPPDDVFRAQGVDFTLHGAPDARVADERQNVEVWGYVVAVKPREDDHDFHVIISDGPLGKGSVFMNVEVSGRPRNGVDDAAFVRARQQVESAVPEVKKASSGYIRIAGERRVHIQGSLFFDGDHQAGCLSGCPGPAYAKPSTVWEIHPVYLMEAAGDAPTYELKGHTTSSAPPVHLTRPHKGRRHRRHRAH